MSVPASRALFRAPVCRACRRELSTAARLQSGHSKWATIKHDKARTDAAKNKQRSLFSHDIALATKLGGPNPDQNPRLALAISTAKKASFPKTGIEAAIARGMGVSVTGAALESVTIEAIFPPSIAVVIDCQTDNKLRTLVDIRNCVKKNGGNVTPVTYLFERKGQVVFKPKEGMGTDDVLDAALEAGALDVEEGEEGTSVVYADPAETKAVAESIAAAAGLEIAGMDIMWVPNEETQVPLENAEDAAALGKFLDQLQEISGIEAIYWNATQGGVDDGAWAELMSKIMD